MQKMHGKLHSKTEGQDPETELYQRIFNLDDKIKEQEKLVEVLERALKT